MELEGVMAVSIGQGLEHTSRMLQVGEIFLYHKATALSNGTVTNLYRQLDERRYNDVKRTDNNGLDYAVEVLEGIYTDPNFPLNLAPTLTVSLRDSGKSRADLWAYATILAVEYGVQSNNMQCDDPEINAQLGPGQQCHHQQGLLECKVRCLKMVKEQFFYFCINTNKV